MNEGTDCRGVSGQGREILCIRVCQETNWEVSWSSGEEMGCKERGVPGLCIGEEFGGGHP